SNYSNIVYTNGSLNIGQATASISASKTYDSNTSLTTGQVSITGVNGQTLNYTGTALANNANVSANATNYVSGITGLSDGTGLASNYVLPSQSAKSGNNQATINAVTTAVNIIGNSQSGTYNGNQQSVSGFTATGLVGTDTASNITGFNASGATGTNAGSYANTVGGTNSNYSNVNYTNGSLNIGQATATINATKTYDSNTSLTPGQVSITGVNGQTLNYTGTAVANNANVAANATNYVSGITGLSDGTGLASNYLLPSLSGVSANNNATITAAALTVSANNATKIAGENAILSGFTSKGLQGQDVIDAVSLLSSGASVTASPGSYEILTSKAQGSHFDATNYAITYVNGQLNVTVAPPQPVPPAPGPKPFNQPTTQKQDLPVSLTYNDFISVQTFTPLAIPQATAFVFTLPPDTFVYSKRTTSVVLEANLINGESLPSWLKFEGATGTFRGTPPIDMKDLEVIVTANDGSGAQAQTKLTLLFNKT
ncbi:MBG domain-containing protein, partial [Undibacterium sp. SXout20W]|uniref:MBG domain-containing protein n=2 Tax=Undibacterium sp. SXout20W TaxID=3413051 RepID=UPI003BF233E7